MRFSPQERSHRTLSHKDISTESQLHGAGCCALMTKRRPKSPKKYITLTSGQKEGQYCALQIINEQSNHLPKTAGWLGEREVSLYDINVEYGTSILRAFGAHPPAVSQDNLSALRSGFLCSSSSTMGHYRLLLDEAKPHPSRNLRSVHTLEQVPKGMLPVDGRFPSPCPWHHLFVGRGWTFAAVFITSTQSLLANMFDERLT